ncbi:MAG TPA: hypothetical protein VKB88_28125 [Bryobacteraceae bacterium]|nr:hypothetical protein [Bryobacteraceae bacterium]
MWDAAGEFIDDDYCKHFVAGRAVRRRRDVERAQRTVGKQVVIAISDHTTACKGL